MEGVTDKNRNLITELGSVAARNVLIYPPASSETPFGKELFSSSKKSPPAKLTGIPQTPEQDDGGSSGNGKVKLGPLTTH